MDMRIKYATLKRFAKAACSVALSIVMVVSLAPSPLAYGEAATKDAQENEQAAQSQQTIQDASNAQAEPTTSSEQTTNPNERTIIFDGNGATGGTMDEFKFIEGDPVTLPDNAFIRTDYQFDGWSTTPDGEDMLDATGAITMPAIKVPDATSLINEVFSWDVNGDATIDSETEKFNLTPCYREQTLKLYAQWKPIPVDETAQATQDSAAEASDATNADPKATDPAATTNDLQVRDIDNGAGDELSLEVKSLSPAEQQIAQIRSRLMSNGPLRASSASTDNPEGDGTSIDSVALTWVTPDTTDDGNASHLYLAPSGNNEQSLIAQMVVTLSGQHDYAPGDIRVRIPASILTSRLGYTYGTLALPLAESPSTKTDFNWTIDGDECVITNTRTMSAATQFTIQFSYEDIRPSSIIDMQTTDDVYANVSVLTNAGNTLTRSSDKLNAQIDTHETITSANKEYSSHKIVEASQIDSSRIPDDLKDEEYFVVVNWRTFCYLEGNTYSTVTWTDDLEGDSGTGYRCFVSSESSESWQHTVLSDDWRENGMSSMREIQTAYPLSQFNPDTTYQLTNTTTWTCTETDSGEQSTKTAVKTIDFSYQNPGVEHPTGNFYHEKWGVDDDGWATSHNDMKDYTSYGKYAETGWYGSYPSSLNRLRHGDDANAYYYEYLRGYTLPWLQNENTTGTSLADFEGTSVTMTMTDDNVEFADAVDHGRLQLTPGTDFDFTSLRLLKPVIYKAVAYDSTGGSLADNVYDENGNIIYTGPSKRAHGGSKGVGYVRDYDPADIPAFTVEAQVDGAWTTVATVDWSDGATTKDVALPAGTTAWRYSTTLSITDDTSCAAVQDAFVRPQVTLHPSTLVMSLVNQAMENQVMPTTYLTNHSSMTATQDATATRPASTILVMPREGTDRLKGYDESLSAVPNKSVEQQVDNTNQVVNLTYKASVEERTNITSIDTWREAVAAGDIRTETSGTWYDLLPRGVTPDLSTIELRDNDGDFVQDAYTVPNWRGTGRTMLVVKVNLTPTPVYYAASSSLSRVEDVPEITFEANYPFSAMEDWGATMHNVIAFESGNNELGNVTNYSGEPDTPFSNNNTVTNNENAGDRTTFVSDEERNAMVDLDTTTDKPAFVYAGISSHASALVSAVAELRKDACANYDGEWRDGVESDAVTAWVGGPYSYRLSISSATDMQTGDMIFYDILENFVPDDTTSDYNTPSWKGTLTSVDTSQLSSMGIEPVVYYCTRSDIAIAATGDESQRTAAADLANSDWWSTTPPADLSTVTAVAIDATHDADGNAFLLPENATASVYINMMAPTGETGLTYAAQDAHAFNNTYLWSSSTNTDTGTTTDPKLIRKDYTKVGIAKRDISVTKVFDDDEDRDGLRPSQVTVHLYANGADTGRAVTLDGSVDEGTGDRETTAWIATFENVAYADAEGNAISYSFVEDPIEGYEQSTIHNSDESVTLINRHVPEKVSFSGTKEWAGDEQVTRPSYITLNLLADGDVVATQIVIPDMNGTWSYSFTDLPKYRDNGTPIVYTFSETGNEDYAITQTDTGLLNTYHPYGDLRVTKTLDGASTTAAKQLFSFTTQITEADGTPYMESLPYEIVNKADGSVVTTGTVPNGTTLQITADQQLVFKELPKGLKYQVTETPVDGFTTDTQEFTGTIWPNKTAEASFTNSYTTQGRVAFKATKTLDGAHLKANMCLFGLYNENGDLIRTATNDAFGNVIFPALRYSAADDGITYTYTVAEIDSGKTGYIYDITSYKVAVTPHDDGHGHMTCEAVYYNTDGSLMTDGALPSFTNTYAATGTTTLSAYKLLPGGTLTAGQFTFQMEDETGAPLYRTGEGRVTTQATSTVDGETVENDLFTATNDASGLANFQPIVYTMDDLADRDDVGNVTGYSAKTFIYTAREVIPDDAIAYNSENNMVDATGTVVTDASLALTYGAANATQRSDYNFVKDSVLYTKETRSWRVTVQDDSSGSLAVTAETVTKNDDTGEWEYTPMPASFTNQPQPGKLAVQKYIENENDDNRYQTFTYKVKVTMPDGTPLPDGTYNYTLSEADDIGNASDSTAESVSSSATNQTSSADTTPDTHSVTVGDATSDGTDASVSAISQLMMQTDSMEYTLSNSEFDAMPKTDESVAVKESRAPISDPEQEADAEDDAAGSTADAASPLPSPKRAYAATPYSTDSKAYAVVLDNDTTLSDGTTLAANTLVFIRSNDDLTVPFKGLDGTIKDCENNEYTGKIYGDFENTKYSWYDYPPWHASAKTITAVVVKDQIKPVSLATWFFDLTKVTSYDVANIDTSDVQYFYDCFGSNWGSRIASIDISAWDMSNAVSLDDMFERCRELKTVKFPEDFDTSHVTDTSGMFYGCYELGNIDFSQQDFSNVKDASFMFGDCESMTDIKLGRFENVTNCEAMFQGCWKARSIDVSQMDTSHVTDMSYMFSGCSRLRSIDVTHFDTSNVTSMSRMFQNCGSLSSLDLSSFNTGKVKSFNGMFNYCTGISSLDVSNFDTGNGTNFKQMFSGCQRLSSLDLANFDMRNATTVESFFSGCYNLNHVNLGPYFTFKTSSTSSALPNTSSTNQRYTNDWERIDGSNKMSGTDLSEQFPGDENSLVGDWYRSINRFTVYFDKNNDEAVGSASPMQFNGDSITLPSTSRYYQMGKTAWCWNTKPDGSGRRYYSFSSFPSWNDSKYTEDVTLYAQWRDGDTSVTPSDGVFELTLKGGEKATFDNVPAGATYEIIESSTPGWTLVSSSNENGTIVQGATSTASFTNRYTPDSASNQLRLSKTLDGKAPAAGTYQFQLYSTDSSGAQDELIETVSNDENGMASFTPVTVTKSDFGEQHYLYKGYIIREVIPEGATDNGDGTYTYEGVIYDGAIWHTGLSFSNYDEYIRTWQPYYDYQRGESEWGSDRFKARFENKTQPASLAISKTIAEDAAGDHAHADRTFDFTVNLTRQGTILSGEYPYTVANADGSAGESGTVASGGVIALADGQTATITDLPANTTYSVTEAPAGAGWSQSVTGATGTIAAGDTAHAAFSNAYRASGKVQLAASKTLDNDTLEPGDYEFELVGPDGTVLQTITNGAGSDAGTVTFEPLEITKVGTTTYTIREAAGSDDNITYDQSTYQAIVTATDNGDGTLACSTIYVQADGTTPISGEAPAFSNTHKTGNVSLTKHVEGATDASSGRTFTFDIALSAEGSFPCTVTDAEGSQVSTSTVADGAPSS